jgi:NAD(P)-dependent dehydrogenase (short-subunit alcohol dehydrogenase family)
VNFSSSAVGLALPSYAAHAASKSASDATAPVLERPGAAADIANLVAFLVSEDGRWVDGQVIRGEWRHR